MGWDSRCAALDAADLGGGFIRLYSYTFIRLYVCEFIRINAYEFKRLCVCAFMSLCVYEYRRI